jgi:hypothetical protein
MLPREFTSCLCRRRLFNIHPHVCQPHASTIIAGWLDRFAFAFAAACVFTFPDPVSSLPDPLPRFHRLAQRAPAFSPMGARIVMNPTNGNAGATAMRGGAHSGVSSAAHQQGTVVEQAPSGSRTSSLDTGDMTVGSSASVYSTRTCGSRGEKWKEMAVGR